MKYQGMLFFELWTDILTIDQDYGPQFFICFFLLRKILHLVFLFKKTSDIVLRATSWLSLAIFNRLYKLFVIGCRRFH